MLIYVKYLHFLVISPYFICIIKYYVLSLLNINSDKMTATVILAWVISLTALILLGKAFYQMIKVLTN